MDMTGRVRVAFCACFLSPRGGPRWEIGTANAIARRTEIRLCAVCRIAKYRGRDSPGWGRRLQWQYKASCAGLRRIDRRLDRLSDTMDLFTAPRIYNSVLYCRLDGIPLLIEFPQLRAHIVRELFQYLVCLFASGGTELDLVEECCSPRPQVT